jgi:hypothetical protein
VELAERLARILNLTFKAFDRAQLSAVADLPAAFAVKWRLVEQDLHGFALDGTIRADPVLDDRENDPLTLIARIAGELGCSEFLGEIEPQLV